jgi:ABC-type cobalamin transport system ATPase subunit
VLAGAQANGDIIGADHFALQEVEAPAVEPDQAPRTLASRGQHPAASQHYFARLAGRPVKHDAELREYLDRVGLDRRAAEMRVETYSKGMRQKVGLAIAMAKAARAVLLDEPLSGLDPHAASEFCALVRRLAQAGTAVLMVTHDLFRAKEIGDRVGIMKAGRLVEHLATAELSHAQLERIYLDHRARRGRQSRGDLNVTLLLFAWAGWNLIVPASVAAVAEAIYPPPSRLAYLAQAREIEVATERSESDVAHAYANDHPDMVIDEASEIPAYVRTAFFVTSAVDRATRPVLAAFEQAAAQRDSALGLLRHASPAIVLHGLLNDIAGTSSARHRRYEAAARALKATYAELAGPYVVAGRRLPLPLAASLPQFQLDEEGMATVFWRHAVALLWLLLVSGVVLVAADRRMRRVEGALTSSGAPPPGGMRWAWQREPRYAESVPVVPNVNVG